MGPAHRTHTWSSSTPSTGWKAATTRQRLARRPPPPDPQSLEPTRDLLRTRRRSKMRMARNRLQTGAFGTRFGNFCMASRTCGREIPTNCLQIALLAARRAKASSRIDADSREFGHRMGTRHRDLLVGSAPSCAHCYGTPGRWLWSTSGLGSRARGASMITVRSARRCRPREPRPRRGRARTPLVPGAGEAGPSSGRARPPPPAAVPYLPRGRPGQGCPSARGDGDLAPPSPAVRFGRQCSHRSYTGC